MGLFFYQTDTTQENVVASIDIIMTKSYNNERDFVYLILLYDVDSIQKF